MSLFSPGKDGFPAPQVLFLRYLSKHIDLPFLMCTLYCHQLTVLQYIYIMYQDDLHNDDYEWSVYGLFCSQWCLSILLSAHGKGLPEMSLLLWAVLLPYQVPLVGHNR